MLILAIEILCDIQTDRHIYDIETNVEKFSSLVRDTWQSLLSVFFTSSDNESEPLDERTLCDTY